METFENEQGKFEIIKLNYNSNKHVFYKLLV